jgi:hypothetical protein
VFEVSKRNVIFKISVTHIFIKQIFRAAEKEPLSSPPLFLFHSREFGYGCEAGWNRVKRSRKCYGHKLALAVSS